MHLCILRFCFQEAAASTESLYCIFSLAVPQILCKAFCLWSSTTAGRCSITLNCISVFYTERIQNRCTEYLLISLSLGFSRDWRSQIRLSYSSTSESDFLRTLVSLSIAASLSHTYFHLVFFSLYLHSCTQTLTVQYFCLLGAMHDMSFWLKGLQTRVQKYQCISAINKLSPWKA